MNARVLIVEDAKSTARALKTMLELHDYEVVGEAMDGVRAVELYGELRPDIVLMDIALPRKHGIDATREIKEIDPDARIIAVTALYSPEKKKEAMDAGVAAIVIKPFDVPELIKTMESIFPG